VGNRCFLHMYLCNLVQVDAMAKANKNSSDVPINSVLSVLKSRHIAALDIFKAARNEDALLCKEAANSCARK